MAGACLKLPTWLLDHLAQAETNDGGDRVAERPASAVTSSADGEENHIALALQLLTDPDEAVRDRMIQRLKICEHYRNRRRQKAAGQEVEAIAGIPQAVY